MIGYDCLTRSSGKPTASCRAGRKKGSRVLVRLPNLAFGNPAAVVVNNGREAVDGMARVVPSMNYLNTDTPSNFATKFVSKTIGDVSIMATAVTAAQMEIDDSLGWHLVVPFFGTSKMTSERSSITLEPGLNAALMPNVRRLIDSSTRSAVVANLQIERLRATAATIAGQTSRSFVIGERPQELDLRQQRGMFRSFQHICGLIDATSADPRYAEMLGVDDLLYRWTVQALGLLTPADQTASGDVEHHRLDAVCDLVGTAYERPLTLTEMEAISGMSARALQYGFKTRFGCSPMEWQRRERIRMAHNRLLFAAPGETITQIAYSMGFASSAAFAAQYRRYFGETPSQTFRSRD